MKSKTSLKWANSYDNNSFGYFYFFPLELTVWLVYFLVAVIVFMQTKNALAALTTWLAFNIIHQSHLVGKTFFFFFYYFTLESESISGLHSVPVIYLTCDLGQVIISKLKIPHLLKENSIELHRIVVKDWIKGSILSNSPMRDTDALLPQSPILSSLLKTKLYSLPSIHTAVLLCTKKKSILVLPGS